MRQCDVVPSFPQMLENPREEKTNSTINHLNFQGAFKVNVEIPNGKYTSCGIYSRIKMLSLLEFV